MRLGWGDWAGDLTASLGGVDCDGMGRGGIESLSLQQLAIIQGWAKGLTNAEIAAELGNAPSTIKTHGGRILDRLGAATRAEAVAIWLNATKVAS